MKHKYIVGIIISLLFIILWTIALFMLSNKPILVKQTSTMKCHEVIVILNDSDLNKTFNEFSEFISDKDLSSTFEIIDEKNNSVIIKHGEKR
jgi:hypothetical protein